MNKQADAVAGQAHIQAYSIDACGILQPAQVLPTTVVLEIDTHATYMHNSMLIL